ncbi:Integrin alpha-11 [Labeo rohita]|uniref:Integrin alpha-11 n=1 Tax=Labeo rohita TaxID=84645 RepID=A0ABQ8LD67_LABRO|nr:Integrin alpha-11 [Labeo rohita]
MPGRWTCFNIDTRHAKIIKGSKEAQFGYTVQQHEADGRKWLLVGAPFESNGKHQTGKISLNNVSERKEKMRLGMTLTSNPKDNSFVACGPLWSYECGSSYYSTGICSRVNSSFDFTHSIAPAYQRCETYMDIVIVLDGSNSIYPWYEVQDFLINVLQKFYIGPGQIQYGERVVNEFRLDDFRTVEEVVAAAKNIDQRGGEETRTALAINAKKVMIVITDGESHDSPDLRKAVEESEKDNITLYGIAVLGYYNRRGINPEAFLREIKFIATDPEEHFFSVTDESALKDIMSQAGFSSHIVEDGILVGAVGAYDWNGAVLKETSHGKVIPPKSSYMKEFPEELKNHGAYLGYMVSSVVSAQHGQLYIAGAPRFNHTGKVVIFTLTNSGNLTILYSLYGQQINADHVCGQETACEGLDSVTRSRWAGVSAAHVHLICTCIGSYYGSELAPIDLDGNGLTDLLLVGAPMYFYKGWEKGRVYIYTISLQGSFIPDGTLGPSEKTHDSRFGAAMSTLPDLNGDGFSELVVGAPLEDNHKGAIYLSRSVIRVGISVHFEPSKINVFNKDCNRGGREVSCMLATVCLNVTARTPMTDPKTVDSTEDPQPRDVTLRPDSDYCQKVYFHVHLPFWNGCDNDDQCVPNLVLQSNSDLLDRRQFCGRRERSSWPPCVHQRTRTSGERLVEASRRKVLVEARLENRGENAYGTILHITHSPNLQFSSLVVKGPSDIAIECPNSDDTNLFRTCNVSAPFMRSFAQVYFRLEFEFSRSAFLNYVQITLRVSRDSSPSRFEIKPELGQSVAVGTGPPFNLSYQIQNLGMFPISELLFSLNVFTVTRNANALLRLSDLHIDQMAGSHCSVPRVITAGSSSQEDLSLNSHVNASTSDTLFAQCRINLLPQGDVKFKRLDLVMTAVVELSPSSPMFLHEERPMRHIILEIRKEEDYRIPIWVIVGSTLGGLQLLALLVLALWKLGFFHRQKRKREEQATNEKTAEDRHGCVSANQLPSSTATPSCSPTQNQSAHFPLAALPIKTEDVKMLEISPSHKFKLMHLHIVKNFELEICKY